MQHSTVKLQSRGTKNLGRLGLQQEKNKLKVIY